MHFTREPIIETIITPKEGYKLILRKSKGSSQEEFIVDSVEIVSFGKSCFFRSLERPKCFLVPVEDYEVMEVRETRMVLKSSGLEKGIKIGGGREVAMKASKEAVVEKEEQAPAEVEAVVEHHRDQRRERRRHRKRRDKEDQVEKVPEGGAEGEAEQQETPFRGDEQKPYPSEARPMREKAAFSSLIPPPSTLISETISRYKDTQLFPRPISDKAREEEEKGHRDHEEKRHLESSDSEGVPSSEEKRSSENDRAD